MEYVIISLHNKQFLLKPGSKFSMLGELGKEGDVIKDAKVLALKDKELEFGTPYLDKKIELTIASLDKTDKVDIFKYKSKSRYRRHTGHRQGLTILQLAEEKATKAPAAKKVAAEKPKAAKEK